MKAYYCIMAAVCGATVLLSLFQPKTGEGFVHGYNVMFTYFLGSMVVWLLTLVLLIRFVLKWRKQKSFSVVVATDKPNAAWAIIGLIMPIVNFLVLRIRALIEYGRF